MHESHRRAEKGRGEKHIEVCGWFIDLCTRWGYVRGWHCDSLEPSGERGSQGQSDKATVCEAGNNFFWVTLTPNSKAISEKRIKAIKDVPRPITKRQLLSFLGMCAYCRTFIPNYAFLEKPLRALTTGKGLRSCDKIERPFTQLVDEKTWIYEFLKICGVFWFDFEGPTRSLHDFARAENITFINSPMAEVSHDFAWHAKCNGEKIHHCCLSAVTGVYTTSRPVGHTFRELWQCPLCGWVGVQRSTNRLE